MKTEPKSPFGAFQVLNCPKIAFLILSPQTVGETKVSDNWTIAFKEHILIQDHDRRAERDMKEEIARATDRACSR